MKAILIFASLFLVAVLATPPQTITLQTVIRDTTPARHPDFEKFLGDCRHCIANSLDGDGKPMIDANNADAGQCDKFTLGSTHDTRNQWFSMWYRDTQDVNINIPSSITLSLISQNPDVYSYDNQEYYPVDNQGYGNYGSYGHNYHFTTEITTTFTYLGGEVFTFIGDDDVYVFIDGQKVLDIGGVHSTESLSLNLDTLGFSTGSNHVLTVFQAERHTVASTFRMDTTLVLVSAPPTSSYHPGSTVAICGVVFDGFGAGLDVQSVPTTPTFSALGSGANYGFDQFNLVSFDSFNANTGDVEGRVATKNNFVVGAGYSVGAYIHSLGPSATDLADPFSLVVGRDATFPSGAILPDAFPGLYPASPEYAFIGGVFTAPSYLQSERTGSCVTTGCLDGDFSNALDYYVLLSNEFAAVPDNAHYSFSGTTVSFTCDDPSASSYSVTFGSAAFSSIRTYETPSVSACNANAQWVFNVQPNPDGTGDVEVTGGSQSIRDSIYVLYNFPGTSFGGAQRTIWVHDNTIEGNVLAPHGNLKQSSLIEGVVIVGNVQAVDQINLLRCPPPPSPPVPPSGSHFCPSWETNCAGLVFPVGGVTGSFRDYNVVSFGGYTANTGDVEGRLAVKGDLHLGAGYSIGYKLETSGGPDNNLPFALVVGGNAAFISGNVYPDGSNSPFNGQAEGIYVVGEFTGAADLASRVTHPTPGSNLDSYFNAAKSCYNSISSALAAVPDNVQSNVQWSALILTCNDNTATSYSVTITTDQLNSATYYVLSNCNFQATWTINIGGVDEVYFAGDSFPAIENGVVYNIIGERIIHVDGTVVAGSILAPGSSLNQIGGAIDGKVVVGSVTFALQINIVRCTKPKPITLLAFLNADSNSETVSAANNFAAGDDVTGPDGNTYTVVEATANSITFTSALTANTGDKLSTVVENPDLNRNSTSTSSASTVGVALSLTVLAALLF